MEVHAERIQEHPSLSPVAWLCISDVTDGHAVEGFRDGRALDADGREMLVLVVSERFQKKSPLQRHRMVNRVFQTDLESGSLHSVRMKCLTPDQWERRGRPPSFRPGAPCSAGIGRDAGAGAPGDFDSTAGGDGDGARSRSSSASSWKGPSSTPSACACGDYTM